MLFRKLVLRNWHSPGLLSYSLLPLSWLYWLIVVIRRKCYQWNLLTGYRAPVPVIIVGNLSVGGSGKTPLVMYLVDQLRKRGRNPAVISRGYRGSGPFPLIVHADTSPDDCGDEPAQIVRRLQVPMAVGPDRVADIELLTGQFDVDVVISDDGLQHYALQRDIEIAVIDRTSGSDNHFLMPAGPLREPASRLSNVDFQVHHVTGGTTISGSPGKQLFQMQLSPASPRRVDRQQPDQRFNPQGTVHAVAGIGQPERFFQTCEQMGLQIQRHIFPDHHNYAESDLQFGDDQLVLMTEKDAVKCRLFATDKHWYVPVDAKLSHGLVDQILQRLNA